MSITAMRQALEALDAYSWEQVNAARAALQAAIAEAEKQEPDGIGWLRKDGGYFNPPAAQRTWVGLTDEDCKGLSVGDMVVAMWADRILKEKNHG
jgi:hypothetical protein